MGLVAFLGNLLPGIAAFCAILIALVIALVHWKFESKFESVDYTTLADEHAIVKAQKIGALILKVRKNYLRIMASSITLLAGGCALVFNAPTSLAGSIHAAMSIKADSDKINPFLVYEAQVPKRLVVAPEGKERAVAIVALNPSVKTISGERTVTAFRVYDVLKLISDDLNGIIISILTLVAAFAILFGVIFLFIERVAFGTFFTL